MAILARKPFEGVREAFSKIYIPGELKPWMVEYVDFMYMEAYEIDGPYEFQVTVDGYDVGIYVSPIKVNPVDLTKLSTSDVHSNYVGSHLADDLWSTFTNWKTPASEVFSLAHYFADAMNENHYDDLYNNFPLEQVKKNFCKLVHDAIVANNKLFAEGNECPFKEEIAFDGLEKISVEVMDFKYYCLVDWSNLLKWRNRTYF